MSPSPTVDLRSDTVTKPGEAMLAAMAAAPVGDDVYGEDPTVEQLQDVVADLLGHEAGLFTPTGSMANLIAIRCHVPPGQELLCDASAHIVRAELGAHATLGGVTTRTWASGGAAAATGEPPASGHQSCLGHQSGPVHQPGPGHQPGLAQQAGPGQLPGQLRADDVMAMVSPHSSPYLVGTACIATENTHNFAGGTVQDLLELQRLADLAGRAGVPIHMDGARLWNAAAASDATLADFARTATSVQVCLSKGLGAPVGSVLVGPADFIEQARVWRKRFGGGMRQVGVLAAAGLYAIEHHQEDLATDHARAKLLAERCLDAAPGSVLRESVQTNMVMVRVPDADVMVSRCAQAGVAVWAPDKHTIRLVTHRDLTGECVERAADVLCTLLADMG